MIQTNWFGRGFRLRVAITVACQMAFILFGYDQGVFSGIVGNDDWLDTFGHPDRLVAWKHLFATRRTEQNRSC